MTKGDDVHFKLSRLIIAIQRLLVKPHLTHERKTYLLRLYELGQCILDGDMKHVIAYTEEVETLAQMEIPFASVTVLADRLLQLSRMKEQLSRLDSTKSTDTSNNRTSESQYIDIRNLINKKKAEC